MVHLFLDGNVMASRLTFQKLFLEPFAKNFIILLIFIVRHQLHILLSNFVSLFFLAQDIFLKD